MPCAVRYRALAREFSRLPLAATVADLRWALQASKACDSEARGRLLVALDALAPETEWLVGLSALCAALKAENPRFISALFIEWVLEEI